MHGLGCEEQGVGGPRTIGLIDDIIVIMNSREKHVVWQDEQDTKISIIKQIANS